MGEPQRVKVWDPLVRVFHWAVAGAFAVAYVSGEEWLAVHTLAGYVVGVGVLVRLPWGLIGTRHARFSDFVRSPRQVAAYLRSVVTGHPRRYLGHNPAGGAMIVAMLVALIGTVVSGLAVYGADAAAGPLAGVMAGTGEHGEEALEEAHELFANLTLFLVALHVVGVIVESLIHRENLVRAMFTGWKHS